MKPTPPPAAITREQFLHQLSDSNLLTADDLREARGLASLVPPPSDGNTLAEQLVRAGKLTPYQAVAVLERRFNELHIGNYEVLDLLGRGGMGTVFKARHRRMKRIVALKVLSREVADEGSFVQRFQREVETIAQLAHPNIVMAFDADEAEIGHFLVMEFVNGRDLASEVAQKGPLSVVDAIHCTVQAAHGLEHAHKQGLIHRDIKPANLLRDVAGTVKVADLGLARLQGPLGGSAGAGSLTKAGGILGTIEFMSPEQALDSTTIDHRADIYSLGFTLFYLLAGRPPYTAPSLMGLLLQHRESPIPSLTAARSDVPAELDAIFRRMAAKKPEERYQSMTEVIQALEAAQRNASGLTARPVVSVPAAPRPELDVTVAGDSASQLMSQETSYGTQAFDQGSAPLSAEVRVLAQLTVVLVEPSRTQAGIVRKLLQQLGIDKVETTGNGRQALLLAKETHAQVILSSMHLTDMTGLQLAHALRADPECGNVGFILATSENDSAADMGHTPHCVLMPKPFDLPKLSQALAQVTGRSATVILPANHA